MFRKSLLSLALASSLLATGCGGGGGGSGSDDATTPTDTRSSVSGPLDAVQTPVSQQVISPLAAAAAGTPLAGVVQCVDRIVVGDVIDVGDTIANGLQAGAATSDVQTALTGTAAGVEAQLGDIATNLQGLLGALSGSGNCSAAAPSLGANPLAGGPLAPLGDAVAPVLAQIQTALNSGSSGSPPSLATLSGLYSQLAAAFQTGLAGLPTEAQTAPVLGPALDVVGQALTDIGLTISAASTAATTGNPAATSTALATTVDNLLSGLLLGVLPVSDIESASGQNGAISGPISTAIDQLRAALSSGLSSNDPTGLSTTLTSTITDAISELTNAPTSGDPTTLINMILDPIMAAISSGSTGGAVVPVTGTAELDAALASITDLLSGAGASDSPLAPLTDALATLLSLLGL